MLRCVPRRGDYFEPTLPDLDEISRSKATMLEDQPAGAHGRAGAGSQLTAARQEVVVNMSLQREEDLHPQRLRLSQV